MAKDVLAEEIFEQMEEVCTKKQLSNLINGWRNFKILMGRDYKHISKHGKENPETYKQWVTCFCGGYSLALQERGILHSKQDAPQLNNRSVK